MLEVVQVLNDSKHKIVVGTGFGDEGKGVMVNHFSSPHTLTVRFNGGSQAGHNVVLPDGLHHTFAQFGAGTFQNASTLLSRFHALDPFALTLEGNALTNKGFAVWEKLYVSEDALVITPIHRFINQQKEDRRGSKRRGSVGVGYGVAVTYARNNPEQALYVKDLSDFTVTLDKLNIMLESFSDFTVDLDTQDLAFALMRQAEDLNTVTQMQEIALINSHACVFEGAQGLLLDYNLGFKPHVTNSNTTSLNALALLQEANVSRENVEVVGVTRTYHTRHGAGPFPSETDLLGFPEPHNPTSDYQGKFRLGHLDLDLLQYAQQNDNYDHVAVTHLDNKVDHVYQDKKLRKTSDILTEIELNLGKIKYCVEGIRPIVSLK